MGTMTTMFAETDPRKRYEDIYARAENFDPGSDHRLKPGEPESMLHQIDREKEMARQNGFHESIEQLRALEFFYLRAAFALRAGCQLCSCRRPGENAE